MKRKDKKHTYEHDYDVDLIMTSVLIGGENNTHILHVPTKTTVTGPYRLRFKYLKMMREYADSFTHIRR